MNHAFVCDAQRHRPEVVGPHPA
ncbi:MAG: hypothetical protein RLZZ451_2609, partial [Pseudomonadota bacterium]